MPPFLVLSPRTLPDCDELVRHWQQALASDVAANQSDVPGGLRANHAVIKRAVRLGAGLCADGSSSRPELVRNRAARASQCSSGEVVTALAAGGTVGGQVVVDQAASGYRRSAR